MNSSIQLDDRIVATRNAVCCDLDGEAVILHLPSESYFGLDPIGASIWNYIQEAHTFDEIRDHLLAEYDVSREDCERDLHALIDEMSKQGLVEIVKWD